MKTTEKTVMVDASSDVAVVPGYTIKSDLLTEGVLPNHQRIVEIWNAGRVPVLFFGVSSGSATRREWPANLWNESRIQLTRMTRQQLTQFVNAREWLRADGKAVARWLRRKDARPRLLVFLDDGTLCLNWDDGIGFSREPGTE